MYDGHKMQDDNITEADILPYEEGKSHNLFIISVVIDPKYRDGEVIKLLTSSFVDFINEKIKTNYHINKVLGTAVSEDGVKFLKNLNFNYVKTYTDESQLFEGEKIRINSLDDYQKTYKSDMYIMVPYTSNGITPIKENQIDQDDLSKEFIKSLEDNANYECNNNVVNDLKRVFLGKNYLACMDDEYDGTILAKEEIYLFVSSHNKTGLHLVTLMNLSNEFSPTQIQDQVTTNHLYLYDEENELISLDDYMEKKYRLRRCGEPKVLLSISNKPKNPLEFEYMMASESYNSKRIDYKLVAKEFKEACENNFAQYDFYDIYASRDAVVYVLHTFDDNLMTNIIDEAPILFIMELIMFQNAAVLRTNHKIVEKLAINGSVNISFIEELYCEFGKTIKFWSKDIFKYEAVQNLSSSIHKAFETEKVLEDYYANQKFLEHIVNLRDVQDSNRESKILNMIVLVLTIMQVIPIVISFFEWIFQIDFKHLDFLTTGSMISVPMLLLLVIAVILKRRNHKKKKNRDHS